MGVTEVRRLKQLEDENRRLKSLVVTRLMTSSPMKYSSSLSV